ncbi:MAG: hypothetical protein CVV64_03870 [Candidatus Wallbacteria bacterium HGW-Wallbacteria-1]|uniref:Uncharacterized protein n=1 Tax=Candidatus Wallbacteria bacterium HGW-Wallbacteria-1 TaxID=2013854 RepID=A0A2N1PTY3_9BACT|nr:MAG: hypothetical protein CVV64_03870 [Candidatus Wallbacteria bacterium HGW-Wallbacteria-1]
MINRPSTNTFSLFFQLIIPLFILIFGLSAIEVWISSSSALVRTFMNEHQFISIALILFPGSFFMIFYFIVIMINTRMAIDPASLEHLSESPDSQEIEKTEDFSAQSSYSASKGFSDAHLVKLHSVMEEFKAILEDRLSGHGFISGNDFNSFKRESSVCHSENPFVLEPSEFDIHNLSVITELTGEGLSLELDRIAVSMDFQKYFSPYYSEHIVFSHRLNFFGRSPFSWERLWDQNLIKACQKDSNIYFEFSRFFSLELFADPGDSGPVDLNFRYVILVGFGKQGTASLIHGPAFRSMRQIGLFCASRYLAAHPDIIQSVWPDSSAIGWGISSSDLTTALPWRSDPLPMDILSGTLLGDHFSRFHRLMLFDRMLSADFYTPMRRRRFALACQKILPVMILSLFSTIHLYGLAFQAQDLPLRADYRVFFLNLTFPFIKWLILPLSALYLVSYIYLVISDFLFFNSDSTTS